MLDRIRGHVSGSRSLNMQDLAWALWGVCVAARAGLVGAEDAARSIFETVRATSFEELGPPSPQYEPLPARHRLLRQSRVLPARDARACSHVRRSAAARLFEVGVGRALDIQGSRGEWPWLIRTSSGGVVDPYPVFSVHQDSMAMLFLLPAHDQGVPGAAQAAPRSLEWCFGANELSERFYVPEPFFAYRSIERVGSAPRLRRYVRALA